MVKSTANCMMVMICSVYVMELTVGSDSISTAQCLFHDNAFIILHLHLHSLSLGNFMVKSIANCMMVMIFNIYVMELTVGSAFMSTSQWILHDNAFIILHLHSFHIQGVSEKSVFLRNLHLITV